MERDFLYVTYSLWKHSKETGPQSQSWVFVWLLLQSRHLYLVGIVFYWDWDVVLLTETGVRFFVVINSILKEILVQTIDLHKREKEIRMKRTHWVITCLSFGSCSAWLGVYALLFCHSNKQGCEVSRVLMNHLLWFYTNPGYDVCHWPIITADEEEISTNGILRVSFLMQLIITED